ncbi:MAG: hypothetical protein C0499_06285 [Zymomonas sp.]|nr:hypothetical protein [Zymomonas sp.]PZP18956.1 MAG: hypothetical protein DI607_03750 [Sphingomonas hengshuiensis]
MNDLLQFWLILIAIRIPIFIALVYVVWTRGIEGWPILVSLTAAYALTIVGRLRINALEGRHQDRARLDA